jgi:hypothetical protein
MICVLQFDAASVAALDRLQADGRLPNLTALAQSGRRFELETPQTGWSAPRQRARWRTRYAEPCRSGKNHRRGREGSPSCTHDTVVRVPPRDGAAAAADKLFVRDVARRITEIVVRGGHQSESDRAERIRALIREYEEAERKALV